MPTRVKLPSSGCTQNVKARGSNHKPPCLPLWIWGCFPSHLFSGWYIWKHRYLWRRLVVGEKYDQHLSCVIPCVHWPPAWQTSSLPLCSSYFHSYSSPCLFWPAENLVHSFPAPTSHLQCLWRWVCPPPGTCEHLEASGWQSCYPSLFERREKGN